MTLSLPDMAVLAPLAVLAAGVVAALLAAAFARSDRTVLLLSSAALAGSLLFGAALFPGMTVVRTGLFLFDRLSLFASGIVLCASLATAVLAHPYFASQGVRSREFLVLLLVATLGCLVLAASAHFAALLLGIELIGIPLVVMSAYLGRRERSTEAGFKYLVLAGVATSVLLFGIALIYAETGSLSFDAALGRLAQHGQRTPLFLLGTVLLTVGLTFKLALVPFHQWAPDVFDGAPAPATVFAATASKVAVIAALLRLLPPGTVADDRFLLTLFSVIAVLSMFAGNLLALTQRNIKRMLAYSTIAHNGALLIAFIASGPAAYEAVLLYLAASVATNLAAFGVVSLLSDGGGDADDLDDYAGLTWRRPWMAAVFASALLSLIGVPFTAGFVSKFAILSAGLDSEHLALVIILVVNIAIGAAYYIRVLMRMFSGPAELGVRELRRAALRVPAAGAAVVILPAAAVFWIGTAPEAVLALLRRSLF